MSKPNWLDEKFPSLLDEHIAQAAVNEQLVKYPKVVRNLRDPGTYNRYACVSFNLLKEPKKLDSGSYFYGFVKFRGDESDRGRAEQQATRIIKEVDSKYKIRIADKGCWLPITDDPSFVEETHDVSSEDNKEIAGILEKKKRDDDSDALRIQRENREREEMCKTLDDHKDPLSLEHYAIRRTAEFNISQHVRDAEKKLADYRKTLETVRKELAGIEYVHPEYNRSWIPYYNKIRAESGIEPYVQEDSLGYQDYREFVETYREERAAAETGNSQRCEESCPVVCEESSLVCESSSQTTVNVEVTENA